MTASFPPPLPNLFSGVTTQAGAMSALGLTAANNFGMVVGSPTGGNMGAGTINATALYVNGTAVGSTSTAAITSGNINGAIIGGTTPAAGTFSTLGFTGTLNYSGSPILAVGNNQNTYLGIGAGAANTTGGLNTFLGNGAGAANTTGGENTFIGTIAGCFVTTGTFLTAVGEHALGFETIAGSSTAIGNDSQRNWMSPSGSNGGSNTSVGHSTMRGGGGYKHVAIGDSAMQGSSAAIQITGTATAGDILNLTFTGNFPGSPQTVSTTVTTSQSLGSMATALFAACTGNSFVNTLIGGATTSGVSDTSNLYFLWNFAGGTTANVVTTSVTGSGTEVLTVVGGGNTAFGNIAIGSNSMLSQYVTSANQNIGMGINSLKFLTSGSSNFAAGANAGQALTTGNGCIFIGSNSGLLATSGSNFIGIGGNSLAAVNAGNYDVAIGGGAMQFYIGQGSGQGNVAIGGFALAGTTGAAFYASVAIGYNSGKLVSSGHGLTLIGYNSGSVATSASNSTIIGNGVASTTFATGTGNIYIGVSNVIDGATAAESNYFRIGNNATNLMRATGINTATPAFFLDWLPASTSYASDSAAQAGGVSVGQIYRNGSNVCCRIS